jgi:hypothetical protein
VLIAFNIKNIKIYKYCHIQEHADLFPHEEEEREDLFQALTRFVFYAPCLVKMGTRSFCRFQVFLVFPVLWMDPGFIETGYVSRAISLTGIQIQTRTQIFMTKRKKL